MTVTKFESKLVELHSPAIWFVHNYGIIKLNYYSVVIYKNGRSLLDVTTGGFFCSSWVLNEEKLKHFQIWF